MSTHAHTHTQLHLLNFWHFFISDISLMHKWLTRRYAIQHGVQSMQQFTLFVITVLHLERYLYKKITLLRKWWATIKNATKYTCAEQCLHKSWSLFSSVIVCSGQHVFIFVFQQNFGCNESWIFMYPTLGWIKLTPLMLIWLKNQHVVDLPG